MSCGRLRHQKREGDMITAFASAATIMLSPRRGAENPVLTPGPKQQFGRSYECF